MKIISNLLSLIFLFPLVSNSEPNNLNSLSKNILTKSVYITDLSSQERADLITTINLAINVLLDNMLLEELKKSDFFDSYDYFYPKTGPVESINFHKNGLLTLSFKNHSTDIVKFLSNEVIISFDKRTDKLKTLFTPYHFDKLLNLTYETVDKITIERNGEIGSFYLYSYNSKLNNKLKAKFSVINDFYIKENKYPKNFWLIELKLDNNQ